MAADIPWNLAWHKPGMSMWGLAAKIALAEGAPVRLVVNELVKAPHAGRQHVWIASTEAVASLLHRLELPKAAEAGLFHRVGELTVAERIDLHVGLRWCPQCADTWYHSTLFQRTSRALCPWHGTPLLQDCPRCLRGVDPLGDEPWACSYCGHELAPCEDGWLPRLRLGPGHEGILPAGPASLRWRRVEVRRGQAYELPDAPLLDTYASHLPAAHAAFECLHAQWDVLGERHRGCFEREWRAPLTEAQFICPVAAAFSRTAKHLRLSLPWTDHWEPGPDWWTPCTVIHHPHLDDARRLGAAAFVRLMLHDAILAFTAAGLRGCERHRWESPWSAPCADEGSQPAYSLFQVGSKHRLTMRVSDADLASVARAAELVCGKRL